MPDTEPLVSVIIPTCDREAYLREAVASVFAQTYTHWELIVADDGSTDGTRGYLASLTDPRVKTVRCERSGNPSKMRNAALALATGRYVAFLDDDDFWVPQKLALQVADLAAHPGCGWGYTYFRQIGPHGESVQLPPGRYPQPCSGWIAADLIEGRAWASIPGLIADRNVIRSVGGFDESQLVSEDYEFEIRLALASEATLLPLELFVRRLHATNSWLRHPYEEICEYQLRVYGRFSAASAPEDVRRASRRQYDLTLVRLAAFQRAAGAYRRALCSLWRGRRLALGARTWWTALAKTCLHPFVPRAAVRFYRSVRAGGPAAELALARAAVPADAKLGETFELPVLGVPVRFETNDREALDLVEETFGAWRRLDAPLVTEPGACVRIMVADGDEAGAPHASASYIQLAGDRHVLRTFGSIGFVDGPGREAAARMTRALLADRWHTRYAWIEGLTLTLVSARNRFPVHAAVIARGTTALLLAGPPGAGKSTLAYQAHRAGLRVLADDSAYLQVEPELRIWGMPGRVDLVTAARAHFPDLAGPTPMLRANGEEKIAVELADAWPAGGAPPLASRAGVVLLERRGDGRSGPPRLARVNGGAVRAFLKDGLGISARRFGKELDRALARLVPADGWRLSVSADPAASLPFLLQVLEELDQLASAPPPKRLSLS